MKWVDWLLLLLWKWTRNSSFSLSLVVLHYVMFRQRGPSCRTWNHTCIERVFMTLSKIENIFYIYRVMSFVQCLSVLSWRMRTFTLYNHVTFIMFLNSGYIQYSVGHVDIKAFRNPSVNALVYNRYYRCWGFSSSAMQEWFNTSLNILVIYFRCSLYAISRDLTDMWYGIKGPSTSWHEYIWN